MSILVERGLPDRFRQHAARLYFSAFWPKVARIFGADRLDVVVELVAPRLRADRAIVAYADEGLLGVAAFKMGGEGLIGLRLADLQSAFGTWGGLWRGLALSALERKESDGEFLMDGICVDVAARGRGVGTLLLDAIEHAARDYDKRTIRLDVIDTNPRARALYERRGFRPVRQRKLGPLSRIFGFAAATEMHKDIRRTS